MAKRKDKNVYQREDGRWVNKRTEASRASSVHNTHKEAQQAANENLRSQGGGELSTHGRDGKVRSKAMVAPGNDPNPQKDKGH